MPIDQIIIPLTGIVAIYLANDTRQSWRRYAPILGLIGQPAWLYATWTAGQTGIFLTTLVYTAVWLKGFYTHWIQQR